MEQVEITRASEKHDARPRFFILTRIGRATTGICDSFPDSPVKRTYRGACGGRPGHAHAEGAWVIPPGRGRLPGFFSEHPGRVSDSGGGHVRHRGREKSARRASGARINTRAPARGAHPEWTWDPHSGRLASGGPGVSIFQPASARLTREAAAARVSDTTPIRVRHGASAGGGQEEMAASLPSRACLRAETRARMNRRMDRRGRTEGPEQSPGSDNC
jgi:hypothetical protein